MSDVREQHNPFENSSFGLGNRAARALWNLCWAVLFRPSPSVFHAWRAALLRLFGAKLGKKVHIYPSARIWAPWLLTAGDHVGIGERAIVYNMAEISLGDFCIISQGAHLCAGSHDIDSTNMQLFAKPIRIGSRAWICADAFIAPGVTVAEGCVIGARAVLAKSVSDPWTVWVGNPAKLVRVRRQSFAL